MTVDDLLELCDKSEGGLLKTGHFSVVIPGWRNSENPRIAPGLSGKFMAQVGDVNNKGTLVLLEAKKVRAWIAKAQNEGRL